VIRKDANSMAVTGTHVHGAGTKRQASIISFYTNNYKMMFSAFDTDLPVISGDLNGIRLLQHPPQVQYTDTAPSTPFTASPASGFHHASFSSLSSAKFVASTSPSSTRSKTSHPESLFDVAPRTGARAIPAHMAIKTNFPSSARVLDSPLTPQDGMSGIQEFVVPRSSTSSSATPAQERPVRSLAEYFTSGESVIGGGSGAGSEAGCANVSTVSFRGFGDGWKGVIGGENVS